MLHVGEVTRVDGGDGRLGAIEFSDSLLESGAIQYELGSDRLRITGFRDFQIALEADGRRVALDVDVLDVMQIQTMQSDEGFALRMEPLRADGAPMSFKLSDSGEDVVLQTRGVGTLDVRGETHTNYARLELHTDSGTAAVQHGKLGLTATADRPAYVELQYVPESAERAAAVFHDLLLRDGVNITPFAHLSQSGNLTLFTSAGALEGQVSLMLPDGNSPSNVRGFLIEAGARWGKRHAGVGFGLVPISVLRIHAQGATYDGWLDDYDNAVLPTSLVTELYAGTTQGHAKWRYHLGSYHPLLEHRSLNEPSKGGLLGAATYRSTDGVDFAATLATDDVGTSARFTLNAHF